MTSTIPSQERNIANSPENRFPLRSTEVHLPMVAGNDPDRTLEERFNTFKVVEFTIGTDPEKLEDARVIYNLRQMSMTRVSVKDGR
jgi:hypothetical protein